MYSARLEENIFVYRKNIYSVRLEQNIFPLTTLGIFFQIRKEYINTVTNVIGQIRAEYIPLYETITQCRYSFEKINHEYISPN